MRRLSKHQIKSSIAPGKPAVAEALMATLLHDARRRGAGDATARGLAAARSAFHALMMHLELSWFDECLDAIGEHRPVPDGARAVSFAGLCVVGLRSMAVEEETHHYVTLLCN